MHTRFMRWARGGVWERIFSELLNRDSEDPALGRSRGGLSTKIHLLTDEAGLPVDFRITAGQAAGCAQAITLLEGREVEAVIADKGYDSAEIDFGDNRHLAFSIEARNKTGQTYSAIRGFFRQLISIAADERDVIRLRTNYRKGEQVFITERMFRRTSHGNFWLTYMDYLNRLRDHPEWYNAVTKNCTTTINGQLSADTPKAKPWTYKLLLNGTLNELLYDRGRLVTAGLPFAELKQREVHINPLAQTVGQSPEFSALISCRTRRVLAWSGSCPKWSQKVRRGAREIEV